MIMMIVTYYTQIYNILANAITPKIIINVLQTYWQTDKQQPTKILNVRILMVKIIGNSVAANDDDDSNDNDANVCCLVVLNVFW